MVYVDGFVLALPKKKLKAYANMSRKAGKVWREYGALDYRECVGDDLDKMGGLFPRMTKMKAGELVVFSWITFKSRAQRDRINAAVMKDPRLDALTDPKAMPFDMKRMAYGGFKTLISL